ncbi:hypothetical protein PVAG01_08444 [Phlyctema vagabunda]|uniref:Uncharacterized protein n=1 Tax=Phlyctema vagabunda TaxID=108571 RepID=A0ABR4P9H8_9HELO
MQEHKPKFSDYYVEGIPEIPDDPLLDIPGDCEIYQQRLQPEMINSISVLGPNVYSVGSLILCHRLDEGNITIPASAVCSWTDDGMNFYLERRAEPLEGRVPEGEPAPSTYPRGFGTDRGFWNPSPHIRIRSKAWTEGQTTEATTIEWIRKNVPSVPTEDVLYHWIDPAWDRSFMLAKVVDGIPYDIAWHYFTQRQKCDVAEQVAGFAKSLAEHTSDFIETVQGTGMPGQWRLAADRVAYPGWKKRIEARASRDEYKEYYQRRAARLGLVKKIPGLDEPFVLQNRDFIPENIHVTIPKESDADQRPRVILIVNWDRVGYIPKWKMATDIRIKRDLFMVPLQYFAGEDWMIMLSNECVRAGFPLAWEHVVERETKGRLRHHPNTPFSWFYCDALIGDEGACWLHKTDDKELDVER